MKFCNRCGSNKGTSCNCVIEEAIAKMKWERMCKVDDRTKEEPTPCEEVQAPEIKNNL